jgi:hypothetical protein
MIDAGGDMMTIGPRAQEKGHLARRHILPRQSGEMPLDRKLAGMIGQAGDFLAQPRGFRDVGEQRIDGRRADAVKHLAPVGIGQGQVAHDFFL